MKACGAFLFAVTVWSLLVPHSLAQTRSAPNPARVASFQRKLQHLQSNGAQPHPDPSPTELSEQEINAYFASGNVELPAGVQSVVFQEQPGMIIGTARVDFDQLKAGKNSYNPLLSIFSGLHDVVVTSHAYGAKGQGLVHVDSVSLDGVDVTPIRFGTVRGKIPQAEVSRYRHGLAICVAGPRGLGGDRAA